MSEVIVLFVHLSELAIGIKGPFYVLYIIYLAQLPWNDIAFKLVNQILYVYNSIAFFGLEDWL